MGVIGLGYVGLPLAVATAQAGFQTLGLNKNLNKVSLVNQGKNYIEDIESNLLRELVQSRKLKATTDFSKLGELDIICLCLPTPLSKTKEPDISAIKEAAQTISQHLREEQLIALESTTYPGTTEEIVLPILERSGLKTGRDFYLAYSSERVDPGNKRYTIRNTPKVIGGVTPECTELAKLFYEQIVQKIVMVSSPRAAEMTKLLENIFRCVNIALVNELMILCDRMDINIWEVVEAASTKPFGFMTFFPGPGMGGHCIPVDPFYLSWKAREYNFHTEFIELAGKINENMPYYVASKISEALNAQQKSINGSKILVLGVAYKKDIGDTRESPAIKVIELLAESGANIFYHDPLVDQVIAKDKIYHSHPLDEQLIKNSDCTVIITDHSNVDYGKVAQHSQNIVDMRNVLAGFKS